MSIGGILRTICLIIGLLLLIFTIFKSISLVSLIKSSRDRYLEEIESHLMKLLRAILFGGLSSILFILIGILLE